MTDSYEKMKRQKDAILRAGRHELTRIYDILAGIERRLALFAMSMLESGWNGEDVSGADIQEEALRLGLIEETKFDPEVHSQDEGYVLEPGDTYYVPVADLRGILDGTSLHAFPIRKRKRPEVKMRVLDLFSGIGGFSLGLDDRAVCFEGDFSKLDPARMAAFKPWNKRPPVQPNPFEGE